MFCIFLGVGWKRVSATPDDYVYIHEAGYGCTFEIRYWTEAYAIYTTVNKPAGGGVLSPILSTTGFANYLEVYCEANSYKIKVKSSTNAGNVAVYYRYIKLGG